MSATDTDVEQNGVAGYAPGENRPLAPYAALVATYGTATAVALLLLSRRGHQLPERIGVGDVVLLGVATHKLSRLIAKDKVTSFIRAPFTRFQGPGAPGEVEEEPVGEGARLAIGEMLVCPYCLAQWIACAFTLGLVGAPRLTRLLATVFVAHTVSDFLQVAYRLAEEQQ
ncbi:MAG TPA: DUF1360 domain-containing protein [Solirubrobacteraceae bacterium]|nr:DUF1360 domain-containing protein [Solirubrobacteraceae bacterium]